ncbi:response regulator [Actinomadura sp. NPDC048021]|uniref:response regulator transcription factor n=1 Tax=Actinomadura sp. NPDC048021 TaxID=3155385 RepID=UPI00340D23E7
MVVDHTTYRRGRIVTSLQDTRILVADDQTDVAETLCAVLRANGASLTVVDNGEEAISKITTETFDLAIIDMKMPPGEWGGLWLLERFREEKICIPTLVLSGEGTKRQTIEAMRLGAVDWVDKSVADEELLRQCSSIIDDCLSRALENAGHFLPITLAVRYTRYLQLDDTESATMEGLRIIEGFLKFAGIVGFSTLEPSPLRATRASQLTKPSFGTWFAICTELSKRTNNGGPFFSLMQCLIPDQTMRDRFQKIVHMRNTISHSGYIPSRMDRQSLERTLSLIAHRLISLWHFEIVLPISMTYDGTRFSHSVLRVVGSGQSKRGIVEVQRPLKTAQLAISGQKYPPQSLSPWLVVGSSQEPREVQCYIYDGIKTRQRDSIPADAQLVYSNVRNGQRESPPGSIVQTWSDISNWTLP